MREEEMAARELSPSTEKATPQERASAGLRFRKKPVVIEAFRLGEHWPDWWAEKHVRNEVTTHNEDGRLHGGPDYALIHTLEGVMRAERADWIIRGVKGEVYPCKPDIFAETYDVADAALSPEAKGFIAFLREAASYFSSRPTKGEDSAHWANVTNAENCRKIAAYLEARP